MLQEDWSRRLGLAVAPLFGGGDASRHAALLDGVAGSFVLSQDSSAEFCEYAHRRDLSWSSMMRNHVLIDGKEVIVSSSSRSDSETISRSAVENDLERFLRFLEKYSHTNYDVVDHVIAAFQGLRAHTNGDESSHLNTFLGLLALRLENNNVGLSDLPDLVDQLEATALTFGLDAEAASRIKLTKDLARRFFDELEYDNRTGRKLLMDLTIRHAGAELFQAAQLAPPVMPLQKDLWGLRAPSLRIRPHSLKEIAYTPVGLARILTEQALSSVRLGRDNRLTVMDPTCGSGSFLVETLAALTRAEWTSPVTILGFDISDSAVSTARFALECAKRHNVGFDVHVDIRKADFLSLKHLEHEVDLVLMNPPFRSWPDMHKDERELIKDTLGKSYTGRPDKCMAFLEKAVDLAGKNAVIAALLPVGVISGQSAARWRSALSERALPKLIATFGDHSLFRFATVNVCAVVLDKGLAAYAEAHQEWSDVQMLWASEQSGAASEALRTLRRASRGASLANETGGTSGEATWNLYVTPISTLNRKPNWLPAPGLLSDTERRALSSIETTVGDLFQIRTGIRAGERRAFIISKSELAELNKKERLAFRPIAEKRQIADGEIHPENFIFSAGEDVESEGELIDRFPQYFERFLKQWKDILSSRARAGERWWLQSEPRNSWRSNKEPRIVSRQWFRNDGFAVDPDGRYAVVQGYAWFPKKRLKNLADPNPVDGGLLEVLRLYTVLLSSDIFFRVAREYSTSAAGGQIALQQKHLNHVPIPMLPQLLLTKPHLLDETLRWKKSFPLLERRNAFAAACYGFDLGIN